MSHHQYLLSLSLFLFVIIYNCTFFKCRKLLNFYNIKLLYYFVYIKHSITKFGKKNYCFEKKKPLKTLKKEGRLSTHVSRFQPSCSV